MVLAPLVLLTLPAMWWLWQCDVPPVPLVYYAAVGLLATFGSLRWALYEFKSFGRRDRRRTSSRRELVRLKGLGLGPAEDDYASSYPDLAENLSVIKEAILQEADLLFDYETDDKQQRRQVSPSYLHEYRSTRSGEVSLCINAYYYKRQTNVNFSVGRMSHLVIVPLDD